MKRIVAALCLAMVATPAMALDAPADGQQSGAQPQFTLPWKSVNRTEDNGRVIEFIAFNCAFSQDTDETFTRWGATLPKNFEFEQVPFISGLHEMPIVVAFYTVKHHFPNRMDAFKSNMYRWMTLSNGFGVSHATIGEIVRSSGIPMDKFAEAMKSKKVKDSSRRAAMLAIEYAVDHTPTVVVAGKYLFHAGYTNGNYETLLQLANGLVSREMGAFK